MGIEPTTYALRDLSIPVIYLRLPGAVLIRLRRTCSSPRIVRGWRSWSCAPSVPRLRSVTRRPKRRPLRPEQGPVTLLACSAGSSAWWQRCRTSAFDSSSLGSSLRSSPRFLAAVDQRLEQLASAPRHLAGGHLGHETVSRGRRTCPSCASPPPLVGRRLVRQHPGRDDQRALQDRADQDCVPDCHERLRLFGTVTSGRLVRFAVVSSLEASISQLPIMASVRSHASSRQSSPGLVPGREPGLERLRGAAFDHVE